MPDGDGWAAGGSALRARPGTVPGIVEVLHARIVGRGYPAHCHDSWALLVVDAGAIDYRLDRRRHEAGPGTVTVLPPDVVHDGRPAGSTHRGFRKRELYLARDALPSNLLGAAVDHTNLRDPALANALRALHGALWSGVPDPAHETGLALVTARLTHLLDPRARRAASRRAEPAVAARLRRLLDERTTDPPGLAEAAVLLDRSVEHLIRSFTASYGIPPHRYLLARRIDAARRALLAGVRPAQVAADLGFHDQAHFTRHFRRLTCVTPGRFAAEGRR